jgi:DNA-binding response OmpR family regulator
MSMPAKRIILVEDERDMADLVAARLKREGYAVEVAHDGLDGLSRIRATPPDAVLLDLMLPGLSGTEIAAAMRGDPRTSNVPIIMLTARGEESDIIVGLKLGADDYITKPFSMAVLAARLAAVLRRVGEPANVGRGILRAGAVTIDQDRHEAAVDGQPVPLTLTEFKLLRALVAARGRVLSRNQLMDQAIGVDAVVTDRTIDVHMTALRRKLGRARNIIRTVRGVGYQLACEGSHAAP